MSYPGELPQWHIGCHETTLDQPGQKALKNPHLGGFSGLLWTALERYLVANGVELRSASSANAENGVS
jgi:hypothetical protein